VFIGLINVNNSPLLLNITSEWEIRKQKWLFKIKTDLVELFLAVANEKLDNYLEIDERSATTLWWCQVDILKSMKGKVISGLEKLRILLFSCRYWLYRTGLLSVTEEGF
jgi:phosphoribosylamine--glycine ligase